MRSKRKVYRNGLSEGDLKVPICGFGGVECKCVCFSAWNLELILSSFEFCPTLSFIITMDNLLSMFYTVRSNDIKVLQSRWNFVKTKTTTPGNNTYSLLITFIAFTSFISCTFQTLFLPHKLSYYAWATCEKTSVVSSWLRSHSPIDNCGLFIRHEEYKSQATSYKYRLCSHSLQQSRRQYSSFFSRSAKPAGGFKQVHNKRPR